MNISKTEDSVIREDVVIQVLRDGAVEIRNVDQGEPPFLYSSGNWGPGYVSIKGLVGQKEILKILVLRLAEKITERNIPIGFVAGNVSGGVVPGWLLSEEFERILNRRVPFVYIRDTRKKGGQKELITGIAHNPEIVEGSAGLVVEELINFAETTCNGALALREAGYTAYQAACILFYNNPESHKALTKHDIHVTYLFTLSQLLDVAEKHRFYSTEALNSYREYLIDPLGWQAKRNLMPIAAGGTK